MSKERFVKLLKETRCDKKCDGFANEEFCNGCVAYERCIKAADYLLASGVIVPPCWVGDVVYIDPKTWGRAFLWVNYPHDFIKRKFYIVADVVAIIKTRKQTFVKLGTYNQTTFSREYKRYPISAIGKTVFLTREEAEARLKEGENK